MVDRSANSVLKQADSQQRAVASGLAPSASAPGLAPLRQIPVKQAGAINLDKRASVAKDAGQKPPNGLGPPSETPSARGNPMTQSRFLLSLGKGQAGAEAEGRSKTQLGLQGSASTKKAALGQSNTVSLNSSPIRENIQRPRGQFGI